MHSFSFEYAFILSYVSVIRYIKNQSAFYKNNLRFFINKNAKLRFYLLKLSL